MGKSKDGQVRGIYTLEFKMESVRLDAYIRSSAE
jgi:hypothetical protein